MSVSGQLKYIIYKKYRYFYFIYNQLKLLIIRYYIYQKINYGVIHNAIIASTPTIGLLPDPIPEA